MFQWEYKAIARVTEHSLANFASTAYEFLTFKAIAVFDESVWY